jgi:hypothetical protein
MGNKDAALDALNSFYVKIDGLPSPPDWMSPSQMKTDVAALVSLLIDLTLLLP